MTIKIYFVLVFILVFLLGLSLVNGAGLSCEVTTADCSSPKTIVFKIASPTGGHAEIPSGVNYDNKVCCQGDGFDVGNSCESPDKVTILKLSGTSNAHVQIPSVDTYTNDVCLSYPPGFDTTPCEYKAVCDVGETCIASISKTDNAQVADCATLSTKICCKCSGNVSGVVEDIDGNRIGGATIQILDEASSATTSLGPDPPVGEYKIEDVTCGTYDIKASKVDFVPSIKIGVVLPGIVDFTASDGSGLVLGTTCEDDCTYAGDNTIHKECDGINGCAFFDETAKNVCDLAQPGWIRDYPVTGGDCSELPCEIECAEGIPQNKIEAKASVTCELDNLIKLKKLQLIIKN